MTRSYDSVDISTAFVGAGPTGKTRPNGLFRNAFCGSLGSTRDCDPAAVFIPPKVVNATGPNGCFRNAFRKSFAQENISDPAVLRLNSPLY